MLTCAACSDCLSLKVSRLSPSWLTCLASPSFSRVCACLLRRMGTCTSAQKKQLLPLAVQLHTLHSDLFRSSSPRKQQHCRPNTNACTSLTL
jgi:hypothetical protein